MEDEEKEIWKDIKGYEGRYQVSNRGRVKSLERTFINKIGSKQHRKAQFLKPLSKPNGYLQVYLRKGVDKGTNFYVHRLVCEAFLENPENKPEVNHINEDKSDNRVCNLEWVTRKENCNHGTRTTRMAKAQSKSIGQYTIDGKLIKVWQSAYEIQRQLGFDHSTVSKVARGERKKAYGYVWKYVEEGH